MTRYNFGGSLADWTFTYDSGTDVMSIAPNTVVTFWSALTAGTQYTDLLISGVAGTSVTSDTSGEIPASVQGPDGIYKMAADANSGAGPRRWILTSDLDLILNALNANQAADANSVAFLLGASPVYVYYNTALAAYPPRPSTGMPVWWVGPVAPSFGGTGANDGLDFWIGPVS